MSRRLRILVIASDLGNTAPGIVFRNLLNSLSKNVDCTLIAPVSALDHRIDKSIYSIDCSQYLPSSLSRVEYWWKKYRRNIKDDYWSIRTFFSSFSKVVKRGKYDCVMSLTSMNYFASLKLGRQYSNILRIKWIIYSVDGIPSPVAWMNDAAIHSIISSSLDNVCKKADMFFSSNPYMMEYQKSILKMFRGVWDYLFTPSIDIMGSVQKTDHEGTIFLYTGNIYGLRRVDGLIDGFRKYLVENPLSKLIFVGNYSLDYFKDACDLIDEGRIELHHYEKELDRYYKNADVLVDIAADIPNDIFLSSKVVSYLSIGRPIIAISADNSPVRGIMKNVNSVIHAQNKGEDVYLSMKQAVMCETVDDRGQLIEMFHPDTIARKLENNIRILCKE